MSDTATTPYSNKCEILAELWLNYRSDEQFADFTEYNDLGLPLAYAIANDIVKSTEMAQRFIEETFDLLLAGLDIEDNGFDNFDELMGAVEALAPKE
jgi:hypothetical protein